MMSITRPGWNGVPVQVPEEFTSSMINLSGYEHDPEKYFYFLETRESLCEMLAVWNAPEGMRTSQIVSGLGSPERAKAVHAAARASCTAGATWFVDAYSEALFDIAVVSENIDELTEHAGVGMSDIPDEMAARMRRGFHWFRPN